MNNLGLHQYSQVKLGCLCMYVALLKFGVTMTMISVRTRTITKITSDLIRLGKSKFTNFVWNLGNFPLDVWSISNFVLHFSIVLGFGVSL